MGIVIKVRNEKNYVEYVSDNINDNLIFLQNYFIGKVSEIIDFKVVDAEYIDEDTFEPFEYETHRSVKMSIKRYKTRRLQPERCYETAVLQRKRRL